MLNDKNVPGGFIEFYKKYRTQTSSRRVRIFRILGSLVGACFLMTGLWSLDIRLLLVALVLILLPNSSDWQKTMNWHWKSLVYSFLAAYVFLWDVFRGEEDI